MTYDDLYREALKCGLSIHEAALPLTIRGLYADNVICLNRFIPTMTERTCVLAEEIGHHHRSVGNILHQATVVQRKQELQGKWWAFQYLVPCSRIIDAYHERISGRHDLAEWLGVTEEFLQGSIDFYTARHGTCLRYNDQYTIHFDPLGVTESF